MRQQIDWVGFVLNNFIWFVLLATLILFAIAIPDYFTFSNVVNILITASVLGVLVIGQSLVLIARKLDLSAEGTLSLVTVLAAYIMLPFRDFTAGQAGGNGWELNPVIVVPIILALGAFIGFINGVLIMQFKMNFFIVTLAMQLVLRGAALVISEGAIMPGTPDAFNWLGSGRLLDIIPVSVVTTLAMYLVFSYLMSSSRFGREVYAVGANEEAARAAGFNPTRTVIIVYTLSGLLAAFAGWMLLGRLTSSVPNLGAGYTLNVVAAAVIGGVSLKGGEGSIIGAFAGVLLLAMINNALNLMDVNPFWVNAVRGVIILIALIIDALKTRYKRRAPLVRPSASAPPLEPKRT
jgi:ribose/xylose/arabinose/galactoside ABC-type transport system permease subunit